MVEVETKDVVCPGCALELPPSASAFYDGYYCTSPECWSVYTEVLAAEFSNVVLFGRIHQLTVDTYAVHHAGGIHKPKSICVHLVGLYLMLEKELPSPRVAPRLKVLADRVRTWPEFALPSSHAATTVFDVAMAGSPDEHVEVVQQWSSEVWDAWEHAHEDIAEIVAHFELI